MKEEPQNQLEEIIKNIENPEITFCESTTYLEFLLSNAKTEEEKEQIKKTINQYLDIYNEENEK